MPPLGTRTVRAFDATPRRHRVYEDGGAGPASNTEFSSYYRCPPEFAPFDVATPRSAGSGYFAFRGGTGYGRVSGPPPAQHVEHVAACDLSSLVEHAAGRVCLPFDLSEAVRNLREEHYCQAVPGTVHRLTESGPLRSAYYLLRPLLSVALRRHLQRMRLNAWDKIAFPQWPVDLSIERLMKAAMMLALDNAGGEIPFIWFWPDGLPSCAIMTHDVEAVAGRNYCERLLDIDDSFGVKASFQVVPEVRYEVPPAFLDMIRERGFEVNVHDLNHDGRLYLNERQFRDRARRINDYGRAFKAEGFRAGAMYRRQQWFDALEFSYDMSVPNVAHLEPQRGGCCTVMPYFVGNLLELPLTAIQDYSLFHILNTYSTDIWKRQIDIIRDWNGLVSLIVHPDYIVERRAAHAYEQLLAHLRGLSDAGGLWLALPRDVNRWWRNRNQMTLVRCNGGWRIDGPDSERARVAYARLERGEVVYRMAPRRSEPLARHSEHRGWN
jgi:hypothetical protein